ncbi:MAG: hypothetical protein ABSD73_11175 [Candidatus Bathyarchaeia archaeon]|jgi:hypothetical protein
MATIKGMVTRHLGINTLKRFFATFGCLLFLISFISPFYNISGITTAGRTTTYYWSYESDYHYSFDFHFGSSQYWFSDYWFSPYLDVGLGIPWILVPMFTIQALTLLFGVASIIFNRRILPFASVLLSLLTIALMVYTGMMISGEYQLGFYLVFPSLILFLSAFVLNGMAKRKQTKPTGDSSISTVGTAHTNASLHANGRQNLSTCCRFLSVSLVLSILL